MSATSLRCLVTGAGRGIGRGIAHDLISAGHQVVLTARTESELLESAGGASNAHIITGDVTTDATELVRKATALLGGLDVLVLNAGEGISSKFEKTSDELWNSQIALNLTAPFQMIREAIPSMKSQGFGRIVVVASSAGKIGAAYITAYSAAKHGVLGLVRSVAAENTESGVTINAVCPGFVDTSMTQRSVANIMARTGKSKEEAIAGLVAHEPHKRLLTVQEVSDSVIRLINGNSNGVAVDLPESDLPERDSHVGTN